MKELLDFLADISDNHEGFFIEAEGRPESINRFLNNYNRTHPAVTIHNDGIRTLSDDVDKWGVELRLYVPCTPPTSIRRMFTRNTVYRNEYPYRLNNNEIIYELFDRGFAIGLN